jgi:putative transposase
MARIRYGRDTPGTQALRRGRWLWDGATYHVVLHTEMSEPMFLDPANAQIAVRSILHMAQIYAVTVHAFVVMPDHIHLLLTIAKGNELPKVIGQLKRVIAADINRREGANGKRWQAGYYEHHLRPDEPLKAVAAYIEANPVRAGLAETPEAYPFSSANPSVRAALSGDQNSTSRAF